MKKLLALLLVLAMVFCLVACDKDDAAITDPSSGSSTDPNTDHSTDPSTEPTTDPTTDPSTDPTTDPTTPVDPNPTEPSAPVEPDSIPGLALSDNWEDFTFELKGKVYQFPLTYKDFADNGWELDTPADTIVGSGNSYGGVFKNGVQWFSVSLLNTSSEDIAVSECSVELIFVFGGANRRSAKLVLSGGISPTSSKDEILAAWGDPTWVEDDGTLCYEAGGHPYFAYFAYDENAKLTIQLWDGSDKFSD